MFGPNCYLNYVTGHKQSWLLGRFYFIVSIVRSHLHGSMSRSLLFCDILFSLLSLFVLCEILCSQPLFAESCCQLCMVGFKTGGKPQKSQTSNYCFSQDGMQEGEFSHGAFRLVFQGQKLLILTFLCLQYPDILFSCLVPHLKFRLS